MTTSSALAPPRARVPGQRHDAELLSRLAKARGQLTGIDSCVRDAIGVCGAIGSGDSGERVAELVTAIRRYLRSR